MKLAMVDIETLGVNADAVVLSVGVVIADTENPDMQDWERYYAVFNMIDQIAEARIIDPGTLEFWSRQEMRASHVISESVTQKSANPEILDSFLRIVNTADELWSLGQFDFPILKHFALSKGFRDDMRNVLYPMYKSLLWSFRKERDLRTLTKMFPQVEKPDRSDWPGPAHDAFADALHQMQWLFKILAFMKSIDILPESFRESGPKDYEEVVIQVPYPTGGPVEVRYEDPTAGGHRVD